MYSNSQLTNIRSSMSDIMFKRIELEHYQSFEHISLDLTGPYDVPLGHAFIYGENGSGKTNLMGSVRFLKDSIDTLSAIDVLSSIRESLKTSGIDKTDAVRKAASELHKALMDRTEATDLKTIAASRRMIGRDEPMHTRYNFTIGSFDTIYDMIFDKNGSIIREELKQDSGKRMHRIFLVESSDDGPRMTFSRGLFKNSSLTRRVSDSVSRLWGAHSLMAIIKEEYLKNNSEFMDTSMDRCVKDILDFIDSITTNIQPTNISASSGPGDLISGECFTGDKRLMEAYAHALSRFFSRMYSDVCGVRYIFIEGKDRALRYDLVFDKKIAGTVCEIPARLESSGTRSLISLFPSLLRCSGGDVAFIDELDRGVHDKLVYDLMKEILSEIKGQLIITTHNTTLLETINPKNAFVLRVDSEGFKDTATLHSICKTQKNNNNRQRYLNGQFDAVPIIGIVDLEGIYAGFMEDLEGA